MRSRAILVLLCAACGGGPSEAELDRLHDEAVRANAAAAAARPAAEDGGTTLTITGQLGAPGATLRWAELEAMATTRVRTVNIQDPNRRTPTEFRGVAVRDLLDRFAADPAASELTFVAIDGFRATVRAADARAYRTLLAIEADGAPIPREKGGPIFLVHPFSEAPELRERYPDRYWAFYVTHLIVGTEPARLAIGDRVLDAATLDRLPQTTLDTRVGWKVDWPADVVRLRGVSLVDALAEVYLELPADGRIVIRGKAPVHSDPAHPIAIPVAELARCKPLLARRHGRDDQPIPARLGGPLALAVAPCGHDRAWVTFVESITVEPGPPGATP